MTGDLLHELKAPDFIRHADTPPQLPDAVSGFLGRLLLLHGVPFSYLVADAALLKPESLKFFHIDPQWLSALLGGALMVGRSEDWRLLLETAMAGDHARGIIAAARAVRRPAGNVDTPETAQGFATFNFTGFILRSRLLSGWPGLEVRAFRKGPTPDLAPEHQLNLLRLERPASDVLLGLADGVISALEITQPPEGLHFVTKPSSARRLDVSALVAGGTSADLAQCLLAPQLQYVFHLDDV